MALRARKMLGLALEGRSLTAAELRMSDGRCEVLRGAEFTFPEGTSWQEPDRLGDLLRAFLAEHGFSARRAVLGLPARWLLVKEKQVPPASAESIAGMMRIEAEREFSAEFTDLAVDYTDRSDAGQARAVLLTATLRRKLEQAVAMGRAAHLNVRAVTSSVMALASAEGRGRSGPALLLHVTGTGGELTVRVGGQFRAVRHLPVTMAATPGGGASPGEDGIEKLAEETRRVVLLLPRDPTWPQLDDLSVWDGVGLRPAAWKTLSDRLGMTVHVADALSALGLAGSHVGGDADARRFAAAAAVGLAGMHPDLLAVDFLHSRLAPPKKPARGKRAVRAACLAAALLATGLFLLWDWQVGKGRLAALRSTLEGMTEEVEAAGTLVNRVSSARGWHDRRPGFLDCLRELTLAFPEHGRIWTNSLIVGEDMRGIIVGKSVDEREVLEVLDRLNASQSLVDIKPLYMREAGGGAQEVSFAVSFSFQSTE